MFTVESGAALADNAVGDFESAGGFLKRILFPLSFVGVGFKMSKWGMVHDVVDSSIGALVVLWSAQVTAGKLMDALDAYYL